MATLQTQDANIIEADAINWKLILFPLLAFLVVLVGGVGIYYYLQNERADQEAAARQAMLQAKTPAELVQVADRFPKTTQAGFALIAAGDRSVDARNFTDAEKEFSRVGDVTGMDPVLRDSAQLGLGSALEAENKIDAAVDAYLSVARRANKSPYAPYAYNAAARLYEQQKNRDKEREILTEAASLGTDSNFTKEAQYRLKILNLEAKTPSLPASTHAEPPSPTSKPAP